MAARVNQGAMIAVIEPLPSETQILQAALISVQGLAVSATQIDQTALISVVQNNRKYVSLGAPITLDCWQPCTAFGTQALIIYIGA